MAFEGLIETAMQGGQHYLHSNDAINSIAGALDRRIMTNPALQAAIRPNTKKAIGWGDRAKSLMYNRAGELSKARVGAAIAGSYIAANEVANGDTGIPFIS